MATNTYLKNRADFTDSAIQELDTLHRETGLDGASLQVEALQLDSGEHYLVTGKQYRRVANSALGAVTILRAVHNASNIWRINPNGTKTLVLRSY